MTTESYDKIAEGLEEALEFAKEQNKKTKRLHLLISPAELDGIDDWRFRNRIGSRADAVRLLINIGLTTAWNWGFDDRAIAQTPDGKWIVLSDGEIVRGPFDTNSEAWRALDRLGGEPISRSEKVSDWFLQQQGLEGP